MTALAYALIIIPISTIVATLGVIVGMFVFGLPLYFAPEYRRGRAVGFLAGYFGELAGFAYAFLVFRLLAGTDSFTAIPLCLAAVPLLFPPINDLRRARKVAAAVPGNSGDPTIAARSSAEATPLMAAGIGEAVGFVAGIVVFGILL